jgi:hypothetical protein
MLEDEANYVAYSNKTGPFSEAPVCDMCEGPYFFDTTIASPLWNAVIRANDLPDKLCFNCIIREFGKRRTSFAATLWSPDFDGLPISITFDDAASRDMELLVEEYVKLRVAVSEAIAATSGTLESLRTAVTAVFENQRLTERLAILQGTLK